MKTILSLNQPEMVNQGLLLLLVDYEHLGAPEKPQLSTMVEVALLLLLNCIRSQR